MLHRDDRTPSRRIAVRTLISPIRARGRMRDVLRGRGSRRIGWLAAVAALAVISVPSIASAEPAGLWSSSFQADPPSLSCGAFPFDGHFCYTANDGQGGVELGVKFSSTKSVDIVGVRAYRTDAGLVTGSLWSSDDGALLRSADFTPYAGAHSWQDTLFAPVSIEREKPYIASYHAPGADCAFQYSYGTNSAYRAGTMVASQSWKVTAMGSSATTRTRARSRPTPSETPITGSHRCGRIDSRASISRSTPVGSGTPSRPAARFP